MTTVSTLIFKFKQYQKANIANFVYKILGFAFHSFSRIKQFVSRCYGISFYVLLCTYILQAVYKQHDTDNSGHFCSAELREALRSVGYSVSNATFSAIVCRYSDRDGYVRFDDFVECLVKLTTMIGTVNWPSFFFFTKSALKERKLDREGGTPLCALTPPPPKFTNVDSLSEWTQRMTTTTLPIDTFPTVDTFRSKLHGKQAMFELDEVRHTSLCFLYLTSLYVAPC